LPISEKYHDYAEKVLKFLNNYDIRSLIDTRNEKIGKKIRDNELKKIPYLLIVGEKEEAEGTVAVRRQGEGDQGAMKLEEFKDFINEEVRKQLEYIA
jgi:threonyl-tRNA synthetase